MDENDEGVENLTVEMQNGKDLENKEEEVWAVSYKHLRTNENS